MNDQPTLKHVTEDQMQKSDWVTIGEGLRPLLANYGFSRVIEVLTEFSELDYQESLGANGSALTMALVSAGVVADKLTT